jgi:hypothetical protein
MSISPVSSSNTQYTPPNADQMAKVKQDFQTLGDALQSGNLSSAKEAYAQLQKDAPAKDSQKDNPIAAQVEAIGKALDSGDIETAKNAFNKVTETISQRPSMGKNGGKPSGAPSGGASKSSGSDSSSSSNTVYDKKDTNKDGTVTAQEEILYNIKHPQESNQENNEVAGSIINTFA